MRLPEAGRCGAPERQGYSVQQNGHGQVHDAQGRLCGTFAVTPGSRRSARVDYRKLSGPLAPLGLPPERRAPEVPEEEHEKARQRHWQMPREPVPGTVPEFAFPDFELPARSWTPDAVVARAVARRKAEAAVGVRRIGELLPARAGVKVTTPDMALRMASRTPPPTTGDVLDVHTGQPSDDKYMPVLNVDSLQQRAVPSAFGGKELIMEASVSAALAQAQPRDAKDVLAEYLPYHDSMVLLLSGADCERIRESFAPYRQYRWLVQLDCGCVTEALTYGEDKLPADGQFMRELTPEKDKSERPAYARTFVMSHERVHCVSGCARGWCWAPGDLWCADHAQHGSGDEEWRDITEWVKRDYEWTLKNGNRRAMWTVALSCGHCGHISTDVNWVPVYGHRDRPDLARRRATAPDPGAQALEEWAFRLIRYDPPMEAECSRCEQQRRITGQRPVGRLAKPPRQPKTPEQRAEEARKQAQAKARRLRKGLAAAEAEVTRLDAPRDTESHCGAQGRVMCEIPGHLGALLVRLRPGSSAAGACWPGRRQEPRGCCARCHLNPGQHPGGPAARRGCGCGCGA